MSLSSFQDNWAASGDWIFHRKTITSLYEKQGLTLNEVMQIMQNEHQFFATKKMYKTRFLQWGVQKNRKRRPVGDACSEKLSPGVVGGVLESLPQGHNQECRSRAYPQHLSISLERQLVSSRNKFTSQSITFGNNSGVKLYHGRSPDPSISNLFPLITPYSLLVPEEIICILQNYASSSFGSGIWNKHLLEQHNYGEPLRDWFNTLYISVETILKGETSRGFRMLNGCFQQYHRHLKDQNPTLFIKIYEMTRVISDTHPELARSFISFSRNLAEIVFGPSHPLSQLTSKLHAMNPQELSANVQGVLEAYNGVLKGYMGDESVYMARLDLGILNYMRHYRLASCTALESSLRASISNLSHVPAAQFVLLQVQNELAWTLYILEGRNAEARQLAQEVLNFRNERAFDTAKARCWELLFAIARQEGGKEEVLKVGEERIAWCRERWGGKGDRTLNALTDLRAYLISVGDDDGLRKVDGEYERVYGAMCEEMGAVELS
ncbi:Clr5 domain-containing protein [Bisporella sp. PMI_857]|nr:Clr5 domain-containing protein [Bisporella sp. PMI_857]